MTKEERLDVLEQLNRKLDRIIELLENKNKRCEPTIRFTKANPNADDSQLISHEKEIFQMLDNQRVNN